MIVRCIFMKKRTVIAFIFCSIFLFNPNINCAKWGLSSGEYHCHSGNTYTNSKGQTFDSDGNLISNSSTSNTNSSSSSNNKTTAPKSSPKSSDNTLKSITIDGESIKISDQMNYKTKK